MTRVVEALADYPVTVQVPVAWGDMDAFQHVNNTVYFRWFETARIAFFQRLGWLDLGADAPGPILAKTSAVFRAPVTFPDTVVVGATAEDVGADRFTMKYAVYSVSQGRIAALGDGRIISFDYSAGAKAPIPGDVRTALDQLMARTS